ncbi:hypothetical protein BP6252_13495 [Coleophoma cylindrospora]|uniref:Uncharacterized protein n=1 Tax=Coleophoma cylindrospora TaxID=1849047 RepID=A0A3D8Q9F4_9HELO|nr:hypothetical protein BP6252_13495 [Coleophoma cylindrospora]
MIYTLLLVNEGSIPICSPSYKRRKTRLSQRVYFNARGCCSRIEEAEPNHGAILRVNKQVHREASRLFYSHNSFLVGTGRWGCSAQVNVHGLKSMIKRVPTEFLACVKHLQVILYIRILPKEGGKGYSLGTLTDAGYVHTICETITRNLTGLVTLDIFTARDIERREPKNQAEMYKRGIYPLTSEATMAHLTKSFQLLSKHNSLKYLAVYDNAMFGLAGVFLGKRLRDSFVGSPIVARLSTRFLAGHQREHGDRTTSKDS